MKRKIWISHVIAFALAFALSAAVTGCLVTAFDLEVDRFSQLMLQCGLFSAGCALCFRFRGGNLLIACLVAIAVGFLWRTGAWYEQMQTLLLTITRRYDSAYGCGVLFYDAPDGPVDYPLVTIAWLVAICVSWVVCRRKSALFAMLPALLPLIACLVVTDTVPGEGYLYLLMLGLALLLLTDWSRCKGVSQGNRMMAIAAVPAAAALAVLFLAVPQKNYVNHFETYQDQLLIWFQKLQYLAEETTSNLSFSASDSSTPERLDLSSVGPKIQLDYTVMTVNSPVGGTLYLRGRDYNTYGGSGWVSSKHRVEDFTQGAESVGQLTIQTRSVQDILYVPYYPAEEVSLVGGAAANQDNAREYTFELTSVPAAENSGEQSTEDLVVWTDLLLSSAAPDSQYRQLPADTMLWANTLSKEITSGLGTVREQAEAIGAYVRDSASYDLSTPRMPSDAADFAQWFLDESSTGYCVHFATATTVLLRSAGIPARYVEGYLVSCQAGKTVDVSSKQAHAWAEYYDSALNAWVVLEATPADEGEPEQTVSVTVPDETAPPATIPQNTIAPEIPETQAPSQNIADPDADTAQPRKEFRLPGWVKVLLVLFLAVLAVWGQSALRIQRKRVLWRSGRPNARALARYVQLCQLYRLLNMEPPEQLEQLAQKARFSQHTLVQEELEVFDICRRDIGAAMQALPRLRRLVLRLIFAIE